MKIEKYAKNLKGREVNIITSGGGKFDGYAGSYDRESNTIDVWSGFRRTKVDADKIVSVKATSPIWAILIIAIFIGGCFMLLNITKPNEYRNYSRNYGNYDRDVIPYRNYDQYRRW